MANKGLEIPGDDGKQLVGTGQGNVERLLLAHLYMEHVGRLAMTEIKVYEKQTETLDTTRLVRWWWCDGGGDGDGTNAWRPGRMLDKPSQESKQDGAREHRATQSVANTPTPSNSIVIHGYVPISGMHHYVDTVSLGLLLWNVNQVLTGGGTPGAGGGGRGSSRRCTRHHLHASLPPAHDRWTQMPRNVRV